MKVLHVYKTYYPDTFGGVEAFIKELSKGLIEKGIESSIFCLTSQKNEEEIFIDSIKIYKIPYDISLASTPLSLKAVFKFKEIVQNFDIIHYHFPYPLADLFHLFYGKNKKSIVTYHSDIVKQKFLYFFYKPLQDIFLKNVDKIITTSSNYLETSPVLQKYKDKVSIISQGLDKNSYPRAEEKEVKRYKEKFGGKFFLYIGSLRYYKGIHTLIDAAKKTGFSVVIAGDGPLKEDLKKQSNNCSNIYFLGIITEQKKVNLLSACYGFAFPSHLRSEAFGLSLLEAAMFQKPMISCEIGTGTSFINIHNETGLIIKPENVDALSIAMKTLFLNEALTKKMGINSYKRYLDLFTSDKMVEGYERIYRP